MKFKNYWAVYCKVGQISIMITTWYLRDVHGTKQLLTSYAIYAQSQRLETVISHKLISNQTENIQNWLSQYIFMSINAFYRYFEGRNIVFRATRPLAPGDVVSENYGPHFMMRGLKERQRALASRYWFKCECVACKEDWPTLKMMSGDTPPYIR